MTLPSPEHSSFFYYCILNNAVCIFSQNPYLIFFKAKISLNFICKVNTSYRNIHYHKHKEILELAINFAFSGITNVEFRTHCALCKSL